MGSALAHSHDQAQPISKSLLAEIWDEVDKEVERSLLMGSPEIALNFGTGLVITGHLRGVQLAKLLYELDLIWAKFKTDDEIQDAVFKTMGISYRKFEDYRDMYRYILKDHPELAGKPIGGLLGIIVAAREGEFNEDDWKELALAYDRKTMLDVRRRVRGIQTQGHSRLVVWHDRDGQVYCRRGDGTQKHCGWLTREVSDDDVADAVNRLIKGGGVIKR